MREDDLRAALLTLFSQHMPRPDGLRTVRCSCGSGLYVGHLTHLIVKRLSDNEGSA